MKLPFNRNHIAVLITLLFVLSFGAFYFFIYVPHTEKSLQEQRFRSLQNIDNNIHSKIENSVTLMNNLLRDSVDINYITSLSNQSKDHFTLSLPGGHSGKLILKNITDSEYTITVNNAARSITLLLSKHTYNSGEKDSANTYRIEMRWTFEQFLQSLLPGNVFDQYIIFSDDEEIYETFPSGLNYFNDSTLDKKNGAITSGLRTLNISGTDYKLFSFPASFAANTKLVITGLLSNKRYQQEKNQLPANGVLLLVTVLLVIIVIYPWLKLFQMGNKDRLTITDGAASIMVSMLLMSLLFFTFFKYNLFLRPNKTPNSGNTLASQITTAFQNEIDTTYKKLHSFDDLLEHHSGLFSKNIINLDKNNIQFFKDSIRPDSLNALKAIAQSLNLYEVYWLDNNGAEIVNWTTENKNAPHGNSSTRDYFKKIIQHKDYTLYNDTAKRFYLDQLVSWTTGTFRSVISIPSKVPGNAVAAMSFNMRSVYRPVLPEGFKFAIIDNTGKVLYHFDTARNLNENLVTEFSENENLISCLHARTEDVFETRYFSNAYTVTVHPVEKLPYFIVILSDNSYRETGDTEIYSFTFSMLLLFFGFLIFQLFVVFLVSSKKSFFKRQLYDTSWIGPKISSHHEYNFAAIFNVVITLLALSFFHISTFLTYLFILMFSVILISIFLTSLFARRYKKNGQADDYEFKRIARQSLFIFVFIIDIVAVRILDGSSLVVLLIYELLSLTVGWFIYTAGDIFLTKIQKYTSGRFLSTWNYARSFSLMALTRLIITSGIPVVFFYVTSYDYEENIGIRYRQLQYANKLLDALPEKKVNNIKSDTGFERGFYYDGAFIKSIKDTLFIKEKKDTHSTVVNLPPKYWDEENITVKLLGFFHIKITGKEVNEKKFFKKQAADSLFFYNPLLKDACKNDSATITYRQTRIPWQYLKISASVLNYKLPSVFSKTSFSGGLLFWISLFVALVAFYFIIYNIISRLFCLGLPDLSAWRELDDKIIAGADVNNLLFIIGLPGSGKLAVIKERIKNGYILDENITLTYNENDDASSNVFVADLINIPDNGDNREADEGWKAFKVKVFDQKHKLIIINHFEYNIQDALTNRVKLNFLEGLMLNNKCKIIILSTIHPVAFLDSIMDQSVVQDEKSAGQDLERWHVLLGHFRIVILPLKQLAFAETNNLLKPLYDETRQTHFLAKLQPYTIKIAKGLIEKQMPVEADELAFKLQITAHYFYMYIWQSLTKEEKFLLYDLAEDNLVNSFDDYNLNMLLAKGVIMRPDGELKLFNKGFRNFILTAIGNSEVVKIKNNIKDNGNWNRLKNPLLIVVLAILAFLLISEQEAYSRLITYVAALATGVPAILKLFSIFDKTGQKSS